MTNGIKPGKIAFTCPICGKGTDRPLDEMKEGALLICPFCKLRLTLHGHMWEEVKKEIGKQGGQIGPETCSVMEDT